MELKHLLKNLPSFELYIPTSYKIGIERYVCFFVILKMYKNLDNSVNLTDTNSYYPKVITSLTFKISLCLTINEKVASFISAVPISGSSVLITIYTLSFDI